MTWQVRSMKYEVRSMAYGVWNTKYEIWGVKYDIWNMSFDLLKHFEVWSMPELCMESIAVWVSVRVRFFVWFQAQVVSLSIYIYTHIHVCIYFLRHVYGIKYILMQHSSKILMCRAKQFLRSRRVPHLGWKIPFVLCRSIPQYLLINFDLFYAESVETQLSSC